MHAATRCKHRMVILSHLSHISQTQTSSNLHNGRQMALMDPTTLRSCISFFLLGLLFFWLPLLAVQKLLEVCHQRKVSCRVMSAACVTHGEICPGRPRTRTPGRELPPELRKRWPLGIDRIIELWDANANGRLLAFLCSIANEYEPRNNLYQFLLFGPGAFHVLDPANLEVVLSTNFKGTYVLVLRLILFSKILMIDFGFGSRTTLFAPLLGSGIFTQEGTAWEHSR